MLKVDKNTTLNGTSSFDGKVALRLSASVGGSNYFNQNVEDFETYMEHMADVQKDMQEFALEVQKLKQEADAKKTVSSEEVAK